MGTKQDKRKALAVLAGGTQQADAPSIVVAPAAEAVGPARANRPGDNGAANAVGSFVDAASFRSAVFAIYVATGEEENRSGQARCKSLFALFEKTGQDTVRKALNLKESGYATGSTQYQELSNARALWRVYLATPNAADTLCGDYVTTPNGTRSGSWKARLQMAREMLKWRAEQAHKATVFGKAQAAAVLKLGFDADPVAIVGSAVETAKTALAAEAAKRAKAIADAETPEHIGKAWAARIIKAHGMPFLRIALRAADIECGRQELESATVASVAKEERERAAA